MTDHVRHGRGFSCCVAHPCIARSFKPTVPNDVRCQRSVAPNTQIGRGNDGQGLSSSGLREEGWRHPPAGLMLPYPTNPFLFGQGDNRFWTLCREADQPALVVQDIQNRQVVVFHQAVENGAIGGIKLHHHHPGVSDIIAAVVACRHLGSVAQQGVKGPQSEVEDTGRRHQRHRHHGGLRHHVPVGSG